MVLSSSAFFSWSSVRVARDFSAASPTIRRCSSFASEIRRSRSSSPFLTCSSCRRFARAMMPAADWSGVSCAGAAAGCGAAAASAASWSAGTAASAAAVSSAGAPASVTGGGVDDRIGLAGGGCVRSRGGGLTALELGDAVVRLLELLLQPLVLGDEFLETRFHVVVEEVVHLVHVVALGEPDGGEPLILQVFGHQSHGSPFPSDYVRSAVRAVRSA